MKPTVLIVGGGDGLSASIARLVSRRGMAVAIAARNTEKLSALCDEIDAKALTCDAASRDDVERLFTDLDADGDTPETVVYNPSYRVRGPIADLDPDEVSKAISITAFGGFLVAQQAVRRMLPQGKGNVLFTGASASVKGYAQSAPFAMGKFALRGLAQSMARELQPKGIHVAHFVIDGGIASRSRGRSNDGKDVFLDPDAIAENYWHVMNQPRNAWTWEIELRPWTETF